MMASERAKRLEEIRERTKGGCDGESYEDRAWLLSELAAAERVIASVRENRLIDGDAIYPVCKEKYDRIIAALEAYDRGER